MIENKKNRGAGYSTEALLRAIKNDNFKYLLKVDGDNQFKIKDVEKIVNITNTQNYDFIKSNRFWSNGIEGNIPKKRYFGNLIATMLLQFITGTNKLYDPLNGLFAIDVKVLDLINFKRYPKRYGYPFYFSAISAISFFRVFQINNTISYGNQKSNLSSIRMAFTLVRMVVHFYLLKIKNKMLIGSYQRSAFLDIISIIFSILTFIVSLRFLLIFSSLRIFVTSYICSWALINLLLFIFTILIFVEAFKEEKSIRNSYIFNEDSYQ